MILQFLRVGRCEMDLIFEMSELLVCIMFRGMAAVGLCVILLLVYQCYEKISACHGYRFDRERTAVVDLTATPSVRNGSMPGFPEIDDSETDSDLSTDSRMFKEFMQEAPVTDQGLSHHRILCRMIRNERVLTDPIDPVSDPPGSLVKKTTTACGRASPVKFSSSSEEGSDADLVDIDLGTDKPTWESTQENHREDTSYLVRSEIGESPPERRMPVLSKTATVARDGPESGKHIRAPSRCPEIARECRPRSPTASLPRTRSNERDQSKPWLGPRPAAGRDFAPCRFGESATADETGGEKSHRPK